MKNTGNILRWVIMATLMSLMFVNLSCTPDTVIEKTVEVETLYWFKTTVRVVRLDYNSRGELYKTHAREYVAIEEHGIRFAEVTKLRELWEREKEIEEGDACAGSANACSSWIIETTYKVEYKRTH